jgi:hypothetical protein
MPEHTVTGYNLSQLIKRFPHFEPSYETLSHKKVPEKYDFAMAIPTGKKSYLWYTFYKGGDGVFLVDMNKDDRVLKCTKIDHIYSSDVPHGTLLHGVYLQETGAFLVEDIYYYKGTSLKGLASGEKLIYLNKLLSSDITNTREIITIMMPVCWRVTNRIDDTVPPDIKLTIPYNIHHIQYRVLNDIMPFVNVSINRRPIVEKKKNIVTPVKSISVLRIDYSRIRNGMRATFAIKADLQCDIYRLYASDNNNKRIYYNTAYIPNYITSVYMNSHFRTVKENRNIDFIEESDDEDDFQNTDIDKNVDLEKEIIFECEYKHKFKRWIPRKLVRDTNYKIILISKLVFDSSQNY